MLESIHIENVALIRRLDITFHAGFSAFTGETGAGKSIIIDSIGALCGARISKELIRAGENAALVEAIFSELGQPALDRLSSLGFETDEDGYLYISRKLTADGKSVCRINGRQAPSSVLRELAAILINIHGQHDNQELLKKERHLPILDAYADCRAEHDEYLSAYEAFRSVKKELDSLITDDAEKRRTVEMLRYQIEEIDLVKLKPDEEEALTAEKKRLSNIEKIAENAGTAYGVLFGNNLSAVENVDRAISCLTSLAKMTDGMDDYLDRLERARSEIYDIAECLNDIAGDAEENPSARLDRIESRLFEIYKLKRKYGSSVEAILAYRENAAKRLDELELSEIRSEELKKQLDILAERLQKAGAALTAVRKTAAERLKAEIESEFEFLEMGKVRFQVGFSPKEFAADGADEVEFLVKTNTGLPFSPLAKTASGGELSRIMLAIKSVIAKKDGVETVIYDEVDTGISGKTARRIGIKLLQSAAGAQVMCVTHSAQIASLADSHFRVSKSDADGTTVTTVTLLGKEERIDEIARIISGIHVTDAARKTALELMEETENYPGLPGNTENT